MATRTSTHILKNSNVSGRPLPTSLLKGEPIINSADGIMYFSGSTLSTSGWTAAGTGTTSTFFEVGSNLYDLSLRHRITQYENNTGANLVGKFLSGTSSGFVLANISSIAGATAPVTGFTYSNNTLTILQSSGNLTATINNFTGLTINGAISAQTYQGLNAATGGTYSNGTITLLGSGSLSSITSIPDTKITGGTFLNNILTLTNNTGGTVTTTINNFTGLTVNGIVSATTISATTITSTDLNLNGLLKSYNGTTNVSGMFLSGTSSGFSLTPISSIVTQDTYTTGFTYNSTNNQLSIIQNNGQSNLSTNINVVSGLTVSNLTINKLVFTNTGGLLQTGNASFDGTNMTLPTTGSLSVGSGGISVTGDISVGGNLSVLGTTISAFTSQLYIEDNNITINYNPTGSTSGASIGAGFTLQDGNGLVGGNITLDVRAMNGFTGLTGSQIPSVTEYNGSTGFGNRALVTQLNDIVIRSTSPSTPNGVRVLCEFDFLDAGSY